MQNLQGRVAVVTGAASGIGLALAQRFARDGMKLVLADIEAAPLARALDRLQAAGATAVAVSVDVADAASVDALADAAYKAFGAVHVLCNNAGVAAPTLRVPTWETKLERLAMDHERQPDGRGAWPARLRAAHAGRR